MQLDEMVTANYTKSRKPRPTPGSAPQGHRARPRRRCALSTLTNLTNLTLFGNQISNINSLSTLTELTSLSLGGNQISNIIPLSSLTSLTMLSLSENQIRDISPLLSNSGLSAQDIVYLNDNPLNCEDATTLQQISTLESRGVNLFHDCK